MEAIPFPQANVDYAANGEEWHSLPAFRGKDSADRNIIISKYRATTEELAEIQRTGVVWLMILGTAQPPVALLAKSPFT